MKQLEPSTAWNAPVHVFVTSLTYQRRGGQLANVVAAGFIWHIAVGGVRTVLQDMIHKKENITDEVKGSLLCFVFPVGTE